MGSCRVEWEESREGRQRRAGVADGVVGRHETFVTPPQFQASRVEFGTRDPVGQLDIHLVGDVAAREAQLRDASALLQRHEATQQSFGDSAGEFLLGGEPTDLFAHSI